MIPDIGVATPQPLHFPIQTTAQFKERRIDSVRKRRNPIRFDRIGFQLRLAKVSLGVSSLVALPIEPGLRDDASNHARARMQAESFLVAFARIELLERDSSLVRSLKVAVCADDFREKNFLFHILG